jgi:hypothetical protein
MSRVQIKHPRDNRGVTYTKYVMYSIPQADGVLVRHVRTGKEVKPVDRQVKIGEEVKYSYQPFGLMSDAYKYKQLRYPSWYHNTFVPENPEVSDAHSVKEWSALVRRQIKHPKDPKGYVFTNYLMYSIPQPGGISIRRIQKDNVVRGWRSSNGAGVIAKIQLRKEDGKQVALSLDNWHRWTFVPENPEVHDAGFRAVGNHGIDYDRPIRLVNRQTNHVMMDRTVANVVHRLGIQKTELSAFLYGVRIHDKYTVEYLDQYQERNRKRIAAYASDLLTKRARQQYHNSDIDEQSLEGESTNDNTKVC